jgi:hypothetical protein
MQYRLPQPTFLAVLLLLAGAVFGPARAGIKVGLTPPIQNVAPGADFDVFLDITEAGSAFNGFDAVISYNPSALTFLPLAPTSSQQGCLMTGGCSASCGNTFHVFNAAGDSLSISDVLLCNGVSLTGPGHLYKLRFHAANTPQVTSITIRRANFYNAGLFVNPVQKSDCMIGIGVTLGVGDEGPLASLAMRAEPNPSRGRVAFVAVDGQPGEAEVDVLDLQGRVVRHLGPEWLASRASLAWDGLDARGQRVPAGLYLARIRRGTHLQTTRVVLLP